METILWPLLLPRFSNFGWDWLTSQTRSVRGVVPRRAMHASRDAPCHSSAQPPLLGGLPPPHGAFQEHAVHLVEWSTTLNSKGSSGTCIPKGVATCFHAAFTAHSGSDAGDWVGRGRGSFRSFSPGPPRTVLEPFPCYTALQWARFAASGSRVSHPLPRLSYSTCGPSPCGWLSSPGLL